MAPVVYPHRSFSLTRLKTTWPGGKVAVAAKPPRSHAVGEACDAAQPDSKAWPEMSGNPTLKSEPLPRTLPRPRRPPCDAPPLSGAVPDADPRHRPPRLCESRVHGIPRR